MFSEIELFRAKKAIRDLAKQNGVSEDKIREEMVAAIDAGFTNPDPSVKAFWNSSPFIVSVTAFRKNSALFSQHPHNHAASS